MRLAFCRHEMLPPMPPAPCRRAFTMRDKSRHVTCRHADTAAAIDAAAESFARHDAAPLPRATLPPNAPYFRLPAAELPRFILPP